MYKYKKMTIKLIALLYIVITIIETVKYLFSDSNIFGLIYLLISSFIIFLLVPTSHNYNRYYSSARISKLIIIFILGIFSSYFLNKMRSITLRTKEYFKTTFHFQFSTFNSNKGWVLWKKLY